MVQVKGMPRPLVQRFRRDLAGRVKYSTLCPSRKASPSEARRAMPTSGDFSWCANNGNEEDCIFAFCSLRIDQRKPLVKKSSILAMKSFNTKPASEKIGNELLCGHTRAMRVTTAGY